MKNFTKTLITVLDTINFIAGVIGSLFFIPLTLLMFYEVVTRRLLNSPTIWTFETSKFLFVPLIMLALGMTLLQGGHATIDLVHGKLSSKTRAIVDNVTILLLLFPSTIIMFLNAIKQTQMSWATLERTASAFNVAVYPVKTVLPIGFALLFLAGLSVFIKNMYFLITSETIQPSITARWTQE